VSAEEPEEGDAYPAVAGFDAAGRIAGHRLEQRIGVGGIAVVFRARFRHSGLPRLAARCDQAPETAVTPCMVPR
jgi:hypothetical protein